MDYEQLEKRAAWLGVAIVLAISIGGLVEIVPLMQQAQVVQPSPGVTPYPPLELAGREVYVREGCHGCHSQMIRTLPAEALRYGAPSQAGESVYDRPFQWGSKRTGPDLARIGGRYSDDWHRAHLMRPQALVPESNMPAYPWLPARPLSVAHVQASMRALRALGDPYTDEQVASAADAVAGRTEMDALVAYLQGLGLHGPGKN